MYNIPAWNTYASFIQLIDKSMDNIPMMIFQLQGGHLQIDNGDTDKRNLNGATGGTYFFGDKNLKFDLYNIKPYIKTSVFKNPLVTLMLKTKIIYMVHYLLNYSKKIVIPANIMVIACGLILFQDQLILIEAH